MAEGGWDAIYRRLAAAGPDAEGERREAGWLDGVLAQGAPASPRRALDLGCGLGGDLAYLAERGWSGEGLEREPEAVTEAGRRLAGIDVRVRRGDLRDPLPFPDASFGLVVSKLALHVLRRDEAERLAAEVGRVTAPGGLFAFLVNGRGHLDQRLQYDYEGAREIEPGTWHLPSLDRTYRFYTPEMARALLGPGWHVLHAEEDGSIHWGIEKRVVLCVARRQAAGPR